MADGAHAGIGTRDFGILPVPIERRALGARDLAVLWGDLGIGVLVLVTGALLTSVLGLGFGGALVAIVVGSVIGVALLAVAASAGAAHGVPTMVLFRPVLGIRGSWLPSGLNALQLVGWTAVELWAMSLVADLVAERTFGSPGRGVWLGLAAFICLGLALWGPVGVTRVWLERFGAWVIGGISLAVTVLVIVSGTAADALGAPGAWNLSPFGPALDLVIAMPISWLPLVADYTRHGRSSSAAFRGTFAGYFVANVWLYALGALLVTVEGGAPSPAGMAAGILALAGGSLAGMLFLVGLLVGETDEAFADIYSGALSLKNVWPRVPQHLFSVGITALAVVLAAWLSMDRYESFLFLIGSVFVPLFGVLCCDHFVNRRGRLAADELYRIEGAYRFNGGVRLGSMVPWLVGFLVYHWVVPTGPEWWVDGVTGIVDEPLGTRFAWLPASLPSFAIAFLLTLRVRKDPEPSPPAGDSMITTAT